ncbi:YggS family pyridoxal phosphate-dependent enzyme [Pseudodesulfovibrio sp. F-1]|uniref:Pyridoxal phosphate homeostasis protein n=1 Tax=Pseudodesulfovibrio alkaliphilus TaxID=2661613 RepID=A0A7K1KMQ5_9BACT|nr:YggS family pyridoxal phosphate-dependent enzyme [Pseudodesulfovibrio alkaliphilus]MUM77221.1 YggS family pyridoxal phosphate-dependent enzyme [Pseudodesulfovibrio alkaliphilus]
MMDRSRELARAAARVREELAQAAQRAGRDPGQVTLVAVSKFHPAGDIRALAEAGQADFGENYVQEALAKREELADLALRWHFIGGLQTNKARFVAGNFALVHSVDSMKLARALDGRASGLGVVQDILIQVNVAGEEQKSGVDEAGLPELAEAVEAMPGLRLTGLMTLPPFFDDPERARPVFARLRRLRDGLEGRLGRPLPHLSMGMTGDFAAAVEEGATVVRIGTRIFGARAPRQ